MAAGGDNGGTVGSGELVDRPDGVDLHRAHLGGQGIDGRVTVEKLGDLAGLDFGQDRHAELGRPYQRLHRGGEQGVQDPVIEDAGTGQGVVHPSGGASVEVAFPHGNLGNHPLDLVPRRGQRRTGDERVDDNATLFPQDLYERLV